MPTWEERMGARNAARKAEADALNAVADELFQRLWRAYVEERGGCMAWVSEWGSFQHAHCSHGNVIVDAWFKEMEGVFSVALTGDELPCPDVCPVCEDFDEDVWRGRL